MNTRELILKELIKKKRLTSKNATELLSITRQSAHRHFDGLIRDNKIIKVGKTRGAYYILNDKATIKNILGDEIKTGGILINKDLHEDEILKKAKNTAMLFQNLKPNIVQIIDYAFTEMLNNAIDHSLSEKIKYSIRRQGNEFEFLIRDFGVGIFNNIREKFGLDSEADAVGELIKGKNTTAPTKHSGEGIFFVSKLAGRLKIQSFKVELIVDNKINDVFVKTTRQHLGTEINFKINLDSETNLNDIFAKYSNETFQFDKSLVNIKLFATETEYISRSQAKRLLTNLEKFSRVVLDFKGINTIGQGFADQIFRIFKDEHPEITIEATNCSDMVTMMIKHVSGEAS